MSWNGASTECPQDPPLCPNLAHLPNSAPPPPPPLHKELVGRQGKLKFKIAMIIIDLWECNKKQQDIIFFCCSDLTRVIKSVLNSTDSGLTQNMYDFGSCCSNFSMAYEGYTLICVTGWWNYHKVFCNPENFLAYHHLYIKMISRNQ